MQPQNQMQLQDQNQTEGSAQNQNAQNQQQNANQQTAQNNAPIPPRNLFRGEVRQVQQALDKAGFKAGPSDGRWGHETASAVKQFQQSKQIQANGQLTEQTLADLGLDSSQFSQPQQ